MSTGGHSQPQSTQHRLCPGAVLRDPAAPEKTPNLPVHPGVIHRKFERNSTCVGVPASTWALGGDNIPLLHSSPRLRELQKPSSSAAHEVPSHHPLSLYWYLHIYNKLAHSG